MSISEACHHHALSSHPHISTGALNATSDLHQKPWHQFSLRLISRLLAVCSYRNTDCSSFCFFPGLAIVISHPGNYSSLTGFLASSISCPTTGSISILEKILNSKSDHVTPLLKSFIGFLLFKVKSRLLTHDLTSADFTSSFLITFFLSSVTPDLIPKGDFRPKGLHRVPCTTLLHLCPLFPVHSVSLIVPQSRKRSFSLCM